jgi:hypothetical protein
LAYLGYVTPFNEPVINKLEIFNEVCILIICYHLFLLTDFIDNPETQYNVGWSLIFMTALNILMNLIIIVINAIRQVKRVFYMLKQKLSQFRKAKKNVDSS